MKVKSFSLLPEGAKIGTDNSAKENHEAKNSASTSLNKRKFTKQAVPLFLMPAKGSASNDIKKNSMSTSLKKRKLTK